MSVSIDIAVASDLWDELTDLEKLIADAIQTAAGEAQLELNRPAELSVLLADDETIRSLNAQWRNQDKPTNVLSFPASSPDGTDAVSLLGDIAIAFETVKMEAERENKNFSDHLTHLLVHGFLHLIGYDHGVDDEAEEMEALERRILARLAIADPYGQTTQDGVS